MASDDHERLARVALTYLTASGDQHIHARVTADGAVATYRQLVQVGDSWQRTAHARRARTALRCPRWQLLIPGDPGWPAGLDQLADLVAGTGISRCAPPLGLWLTGAADPTKALKQAVTITGSRAATAYGTYFAADFASGCARAGWSVVTGGNIGIDAAAHRAALAAGSPTIAVLPGGLDRLHPAGHHHLFRHISSNGLLVSEAPPGTEVTRRRFLARQRLLAALTAGTVLVEAGARSTHLLATIAVTTELGRPAMVVPGPLTSAQSAGCHLLLRDPRVRLVTTTADVLAHLHR